MKSVGVVSGCGFARSWVGETGRDESAVSEKGILGEVGGEGVRTLGRGEDEDARPGTGEMGGQTGDGPDMREETGEIGPNQACRGREVVEESLGLEHVVVGKCADGVFLKGSGVEGVESAIDILGGASESGHDKEEFAVDAGEPLDAVAEMRDKSRSGRHAAA